MRGVLDAGEWAEGRDADSTEAAEVIYVGSCAQMSGCAPTSRSTPGAIRQEIGLMNTCFHC